MVRRPAAIAVPLATLVLAVGAFKALDGQDAPSQQDRGGPVVTPERQIALGEFELQQARETADPANYARAEAAFDAVLRRRPRDLDATIGKATLALARHDFREALRLAQTARRLGPGLARPYAALVDAQIELGSYEAAGRSLQAMIDLRPNLPSYARVSYFRELHGDLDGAAEAMELAVSAGGQVPENVAYVQTLLGDLEFARGRIDAANTAYRTALAQLPGHIPAVVSLARLDAAGGRLDAAIAAYRGVVERRPLPEYVVALGEAERADGRTAAARETFALVDAQRRLLAAQGVNTDVEVALFEADHGDPGRALELARRAWRAAPSVRSADAMSWALTRNGEPKQGLTWARRALKLGWRDPLVLTRAGLTARAAGERATARRYLRRALQRNPRFSVSWAPRARSALQGLR